MTLASFPMTSISSKAHKIDFSYFLFTVDATFLYYVQSRNLAEKISIPAELVVPVRVTQSLLVICRIEAQLSLCNDSKVNLTWILQ